MAYSYEHIDKTRETSIKQTRNRSHAFRYPMEREELPSFSAVVHSAHLRTLL